jgi:hypothetical protein
MSGAYRTKEEGRFTHRKPEGKKPLGRPMRKYEDNIKIDQLDLGWSYRVD